MNEKLRLFIDKIFPPEKKLLKDLTKATKRDKLIWHKSIFESKRTGLDMFMGEYKYYDFDVGFKNRIGVLKWRMGFNVHDENGTLSFHVFDNGLYAAIIEQRERLQRQKELPKYNLNASIRNILLRSGD